VWNAGLGQGGGAALIFPDVIHPINSCPLERGAQMSIALGHENRLVAQNLLKRIELAAGHHPMRREGMSQVMEVQVRYPRPLAGVLEAAANLQEPPPGLVRKDKFGAWVARVSGKQGSDR